ncbi:MAG TPA: hypothetical protein VGM10_30035 [Actinocrinis sp.]|jgi:hypothetical protein
MSTGRSWREIKAEAHRLHPEMADPARRAAAEAELDAQILLHETAYLLRSPANAGRLLGSYEEALDGRIEHHDLVTDEEDRGTGTRGPGRLPADGPSAVTGG